MSFLAWGSRAACWLAVVLGLSAALPATGVGAQAVAPWQLLPVSASGLPEADSATFGSLLQHELQKQAGVTVLRGGQACADDGCAASQAAQSGASHVVYASLSALGSKVIVQVTVVRADAARTSEQRMTVDRVEELEVAATRIARAIASGGQAQDNAELGSVTAAESQPDRSKGGRSAFALDLGMMMPIGNGFANTKLGLGFGLGYWFEARHFSITPRIGARWSMDNGQRQFRSFLTDIAVHYLPMTGDFTPVIGAGAGLNTLREERPRSVTTGQVLVTQSEFISNEFAAGAGIFGRAGVMMLRTYAVRLMLTADYHLSIIDVHGENLHQAILVNFHVLMGGSK